ncbi:MAG: DUF1330 domain-containing protein [Deltaproteobacteria bacterium]|nr:DUF1330 domain-containing protein [Deltaproteobacteria bacterium]MBW2053424.1 DUF1330 domain-containing protein [Deltaproteobacteria bacterium]MBW2323682.1 DUF1330 domain-containing protein [Deltaproteobacteria bacterium]
MSFILPTEEQFKKIMSLGYKGPIVMVNLLKFKPDGGAESYKKYYEGTKKITEGKYITRIVYRGNGLMPVIGDEEWDEVALYEYPSIEAFIEMNRNKEYQALIRYRTEALLDSRLYCTIPKEIDTF